MYYNTFEHDEEESVGLKSGGSPIKDRITT